MSLDFIALGLLREPMSGYDLKQHFDRMISHFWCAEQSQIYRSLKKLERDGMIGCSEASSDKGPPRKVYSLTKHGKGFLHQWLRSEPVIDDLRISYVAQLCFMGELRDPGQTLAFLSQLQKQQQEAAAQLQSLDHLFRQSNPDYPDNLPWPEYHFALTLDLGLTSLLSRIDWCDRTITCLERKVASTDPHGPSPPAAG